MHQPMVTDMPLQWISTTNPNADLNALFLELFQFRLGQPVENFWG